MKRIHKGFTLVELLIVVAVIGVLAVMMTMSSSEAVDVAGANTILSNLQTLKTAAYQMYMHESSVGFMDIAFAGDNVVGDSTVAKVLKKYLGKDDSKIIGDDTSNYGLVGSSSAWYVLYKFADTDTTGVKTRLKAVAKKAELLGTKGNTMDDFIGREAKEAVYDNSTPPNLISEAVTEIIAATYYKNDGEDYVALKVR